jgi:hypothetical protein
MNAALDALRAEIAETEQHLQALRTALAVLEARQGLRPPVPGIPQELQQPELPEAAPQAAVLGTPEPAFQRRPRRHYAPDSVGKPWNKRGNANYWQRKAGKDNVDKVYRILTEAGEEGMLQSEIAIHAEVATATVSRAITALWKLGEIEWMGREKTVDNGKGHGTTTRWRIWKGEGNPPTPGGNE